MFVIDDILLSPMKGFMWIVRELQNAAQQEQEGEADRLTTRLSTLYMQLETGQITTEQFDEAEAEVLARLDAIRGEPAEAEADADAQGDEEEEDDSDDDDSDEDDSEDDDSNEDADDEEAVDQAKNQAVDESAPTDHREPPTP